MLTDTNLNKNNKIKQAQDAFEKGDFELFNDLIFKLDSEIKTNKSIDTYSYELWKSYIMYHKLVYTKYIVNLESIKVKSLEWALPSPPPAHTFAIPVKNITTNKGYLKYRKGSILYKPYGNYNLLPLFAGVTNKGNVLNSKKTGESFNTPHLNVMLFINTRKSNTSIFGSKTYSKLFSE